MQGNQECKMHNAKCKITFRCRKVLFSVVSGNVYLTL